MVLAELRSESSVMVTASTSQSTLPPRITYWSIMYLSLSLNRRDGLAMMMTL